MWNTESMTGDFPTGRWVQKQRAVRGLTDIQLARQLGLHVLTLRSLERNNRVIPPGWYELLEGAGFPVPRVPWPSVMQGYSGKRLARDLQERSGFRHSIAWLGRQLAVPDAEVRAVMRQEQSVPACWLLKLAELGAGVPTEVQQVLAQATRPRVLRPSTDVRSDQAPALTAAAAGDSAAQGSSDLDAAEELRFSLTWSEWSGLVIEMSPALLQDMQLHLRSVLQEIARSPAFAAAGTPGTAGTAAHT